MRVIPLLAGLLALGCSELWVPGDERLLPPPAALRVIDAFPAGPDVQPFVHPALTFSESLDPATVRDELFSARGTTPGTHLVLVRLDEEARRVTLRFDRPLPPGSEISVSVRGGFEGLRSLDGARLEGNDANDYVFAFRTLAVAPALTLRPGVIPMGAGHSVSPVLDPANGRPAYRLFSTTGALEPVGAASGGGLRALSGFVGAGSGAP